MSEAKLDLDKLERVANTASDGDWKLCKNPPMVLNGNRELLAHPGEFDSEIRMTEEDAAFVSTFDPPTVQLLLMRVREAERRQVKAEDFLAFANRTTARRGEERDKLKARVAELWKIIDIAKGRVPCTCWPRCNSSHCPKNILLRAIKKARATDSATETKEADSE